MCGGALPRKRQVHRSRSDSEIARHGAGRGLLESSLGSNLLAGSGGIDRCFVDDPSTPANMAKRATTWTLRVDAIRWQGWKQADFLHPERHDRRRIGARPHGRRRKAKPLLLKEKCTKVINMTWCGNGLASKTSRKRDYDLDQKRLIGFAEMWRAARAVADHVVLIGPGTSEAWLLPPSCDSAADPCLSTLPQPGVYVPLRIDASQGVATKCSIDWSPLGLDRVGSHWHRQRRRDHARRTPPPTRVRPAALRASSRSRRRPTRTTPSRWRPPQGRQKQLQARRRRRSRHRHRWSSRAGFPCRRASAEDGDALGQGRASYRSRRYRAQESAVRCSPTRGEGEVRCRRESERRSRKADCPPKRDGSGSRG